MDNKETSEDYVLAGQDSKTPVAEGVTVPSNSPLAFGEAKRGHKFCGGCCDVRRATIIVNIISLVLGVLALLADVSWVTLAKKADAAATYDDDAVDAVQKSYNVGGPMIAAIVIECVRMVLNAMGIYGAVKYKVWAVGASLVGYIAQGIWALITFDVTTLVVSSLFAYPHVYLIMEMRNGIMSEDTYEQEKFSCCCV